MRTALKYCENAVLGSYSRQTNRAAGIPAAFFFSFQNVPSIARVAAGAFGFLKNADFGSASYFVLDGDLVADRFCHPACREFSTCPELTRRCLHPIPSFRTLRSRTTLIARFARNASPELGEVGVDRLMGLACEGFVVCAMAITGNPAITRASGPTNNFCITASTDG